MTLKGGWQDSDSILLVQGRPDDEHPYYRTTTLQSYLFGYEVPDSMFVFLRDRFCILSSVRRGKFREWRAINKKKTFAEKARGEANIDAGA